MNVNFVKAMSSVKSRVILDVDVGLDDAVALLILLHADSIGLIKLEAVLCSHGNTSLENVCKNVVRLLEACQRTDIPVYRGAEEPLIPIKTYNKLFHGPNGFGVITDDVDTRIIKAEPAVIGMYNIVKANPGEITLVCVGALTNLALAAKLYSDFIPNIKDLFIMGGNYTGVGNVTPSAEYNFYVDPEAAHIVLNCKCPITILTWETCLEMKITMDWRFNKFGNSANKGVQLLNKAESDFYNKEKKVWIPCDALLVVGMLYPESIARQNKYHATVELHGNHTRGQIVIDHLKRQKPNVTIIEKLHQDKFMGILLKVANS